MRKQYTGQTPPAPTRGATPKKQTDGEDEEVQEVEEVNVMDLIPRTDISGSITETLINELNDKNWKVRWYFMLDYFQLVKMGKAYLLIIKNLIKIVIYNS